MGRRFYVTEIPNKIKWLTEFNLDTYQRNKDVVNL